MQCVHIDRLPKEIGDLILLRYINLRYSNVRESPSSIADLCHLQTLDINHTLTPKVPNALWSIQSLRRVLLPGDFMIEPKAACCSEDMHTLETVASGDWVRDGSLEKMKDLRRLELILKP